VEAAFELAPQWASIEQIVEAYAPDGVRLDLGCGYVKPRGFIGIDNLFGERTQVVDETNAPDILMDLKSASVPGQLLYGGPVVALPRTLGARSRHRRELPRPSTRRPLRLHSPLCQLR